MLRRVLLFIEKNYRIVIMILLVFQCLAVLYWAGRREAFFWDEYYTYESAAKGGFTPPYWNADEGFYNNWHQRSEMINKVTIQRDQLFIHNDIGYFINGLRSAEWYYVLFNLMYSFTPGHFTIWPVVLFQSIIFASSSFLLFKLSHHLTGSVTKALAAMVIYGSMTGCIKVAILLRNYMFSTLVIIAFIYVQYKLIVSIGWKSRAFYIISTLVLMYAGYRLQVLNMLFMVCIVVTLWIMAAVYKKSFYVKCVTVFALIGLIMAMTIGRSIILFHLSGVGRIGSYVKESVMNPDPHDIWATFAGYFVRMYDEMIYTPYRIALLILSAVLLYCLIRRFIGSRFGRISFETGFIIGCLISAILYLGILAVAFVNWSSWRYILITYPVFVMTLVILFARISDNIPGFEICKSIMFASVCLGLLSCWYYGRISILYPDTDEVRSELDFEYSEYDGLMSSAAVNYIYEAAYLWPDEQRVYMTFGAEDASVMLNSYAGDRIVFYSTQSTYPAQMDIITSTTDFREYKIIAEYYDNYEGLCIAELYRDSGQ